MATRTTRTTARPKPAAKPNLFTRAAEGSAGPAKKKKKGTILLLPRDLDGEGQLQGESKLLNEAVTIAITAKAEMDAAKGRLGTATAALKPHAEEAWCAQYAKDGVQPETPVTVQNHTGESVTLVVQDKCGQNAIGQDQIELFSVLLGTDVAASLIETREVFSFDPEIMKQAAAGEKAKADESVKDVIFGIVSGAIVRSTKLSDEQKDSLISQTSKKHLGRGTASRLAELCGADVGKIMGFLEAADSAIVRYLKL